MTRHEDTVRLRHLVDAAKEARTFTRGRSREDLDSDGMLRLQLFVLMEIMGEAAREVSDGLKEAHPKSPGERWSEPAIVCRKGARWLALEAPRILCDEASLIALLMGSTSVPRSRSALHECDCKFAGILIAASLPRATNNSNVNKTRANDPSCARLSTAAQAVH